MKHKVSELEGTLLDAAVAKAAGFPLDGDGDRLDERTNGGAPSPFHPSTDWRDGGPIIERERINVEWGPDRGEPYDIWQAHIYGESVNKWSEGEGDTPLIAAMRAYCASKFGEEVEL